MEQSWNSLVEAQRHFDRIPDHERSRELDSTLLEVGSIRNKIRSTKESLISHIEKREKRTAGKKYDWALLPTGEQSGEVPDKKVPHWVFK